MAENGIVCVMHDVRGHGESLGGEKLGYPGENSYRTSLSDTAAVAGYIEKTYPGLPRVMLGHSMGSLIARLYAAKNDDKLAGLILTGTPSQHREAFLGCALVRAMSLFRGGRYMSPMLNKAAYSIYNKGFEPDGDGRFLWMSADIGNREAFESDSLCGFDYSLEGYHMLFSLVRRTYTPAVWDVKNKALPVLFLSGENDPCCGGKRGFENSVKFMRDMGYKNVTAKMYGKMRHEVLNETNKELVWRDCADFLEKI